MTRQREFTTRHALGGSRARIVGQLYLEALVLVAGTTALALVIASRAGAYLQTMLRLPHGTPFWLDLSTVQPETALFALGIAALVAGFVGIVPALQAIGRLTDAAALGGRSSLQLGTAWTAMVALQVALSIAVIPVAGEMAWGIVRPAMMGPGFAAEQFLTAQVTFGPAQRAPLVEPGAAARFERLHTELARQVEALPEIGTLTWSAAVPGTEQRVRIEVDDNSAAGRTTEGADSWRQTFARVNSVDTSFFETFGMNVAAGRVFDGAQGRTSQVVVNRALARHLAGDGNPVGWRIRNRLAGDAPSGSASWAEVVGVVDDLHASSKDHILYRPLPGNQHPLTLLMTLTAGPPRVAPSLRDLGTEIDPHLSVSEVRSLACVFQDRGRGMYLAGLMLGSGALSVLLLAAAGIYALISFTVTRRRREIGIRTALGAGSTRMLLGILGRASRQIGIGAAAGVVLALWLGTYLPVEEVGGIRVPVLIPLAALTMTIVGLLAAAGPARRALRLAPTEALRDN